MGHMRFLPKDVNIYSKEKNGFDYKNNHKCSKSANFQLDNISKSNCRILVIISYILSGFELRKIQLVRRVFK